MLRYVVEDGTLAEVSQNGFLHFKSETIDMLVQLLLGFLVEAFANDPIHIP